MKPSPAHLVASVLDPRANDGASPVRLGLPRDLLETGQMPLLRQYLSEPQARHLEDAIVTVLAIGSSLLLQSVELRFIGQTDLATTHLWTDEARNTLQAGLPIISYFHELDLAKASGPGRRALTSVQAELRDAIAMTVTRLDWGWDSPTGQAAFAQYAALDARLETMLAPAAALFNINASHRRAHVAPISEYCRKHGPGLLAQHYGRDPAELKSIYGKEISGRGADWVIGDEAEMVRGLVHLTGALAARRSGESSRADTLARQARRQENEEEQGGGAPPRLHAAVRKNLVLEKWRGVVDLPFLVKANLRFGLEAAEVFSSRQYLIPLLRAASAAGVLALRKRPVKVDNLVLAGGITALFENAPVRDRLDPQLARCSRLVSDLMRDAVAPTGDQDRDSDDNVILPRPGTPRFFEP